MSGPRQAPPALLPRGPPSSGEPARLCSGRAARPCGPGQVAPARGDGGRGQGSRVGVQGRRPWPCVFPCSPSPPWLAGCSVLSTLGAPLVWASVCTDALREIKSLSSGFRDELRNFKDSNVTNFLKLLMCKIEDNHVQIMSVNPQVSFLCIRRAFVLIFPVEGPINSGFPRRAGPAAMGPGC